MQKKMTDAKMHCIRDFNYSLQSVSGCMNETVVPVAMLLLHILYSLKSFSVFVAISFIAHQCALLD